MIPLRLSIVSLSMLVAIQAPAFADGMPFKEKIPAYDVATPLDRALHAIQNQEPPIDVTQQVTPVPEPQPVPEPEPTIPDYFDNETTQEQTTTEERPPVPIARTVEVQPNSSFFGLSVGMYDPFTNDRDSTSFNLEWQPGVKIAGFLQPLFGALMTTDGALMGYGGVGIPFKISEKIMFLPSVAAGLYEEGDGVDLDSPIAFRVGAELSYVFEDTSRLGINAHILTNGQGLGKEDRTEVIGLVYSTPLDSLIKGTSPYAAQKARKESAENN